MPSSYCLRSPHTIPALAMRHEHDPMSGGMTDCDLSFLPASVMRIGKGQCQRVEEDSCRILEGYVVFAQIGLCLLRIPLIDHRFSLPHASPADWTLHQPRAGV